MIVTSMEGQCPNKNASSTNVLPFHQASTSPIPHAPITSFKLDEYYDLGMRHQLMRWTSPLPGKTGENASRPVCAQTGSDQSFCGSRTRKYRAAAIANPQAAESRKVARKPVASASQPPKMGARMVAGAQRVFDMPM